MEPQLQKSLSYVLSELDDEQNWKKENPENLEPHPYLASIIPLITITLQIWILFIYKNHIYINNRMTHKYMHFKDCTSEEVHSLDLFFQAVPTPDRVRV